MFKILIATEAEGGKVLISIIFLLFLNLSQVDAYAQNLMQERIVTIGNVKRNIYLQKNIFHLSSNYESASKIVDIRMSHVGGRGYDRLVIDFSSNKPPQIYGSFEAETKKIHIDLFKTTLGQDKNYFAESVSRIKGIENFKFFDLDSDRMSLEITLKKKSSMEVFFLENKGRLVIDLKE